MSLSCMEMINEGIVCMLRTSWGSRRIRLTKWPRLMKATRTTSSKWSHNWNTRIMTRNQTIQTSWSSWGRYCKTKILNLATSIRKIGRLRNGCANCSLKSRSSKINWRLHRLRSAILNRTLTVSVKSMKSWLVYIASSAHSRSYKSSNSTVKSWKLKLTRRTVSSWPSRWKLVRS